MSCVLYVRRLAELPEGLRMPIRAAVAVKSKASLLREVLDSSGRYDAAKFARYLDWDQSDIARYLGKDRSAVSARPTAPSFQDHLAQLAAVIREALEFVGSDSLLRAWLRGRYRLRRSDRSRGPGVPLGVRRWGGAGDDQDP